MKEIKKGKLLISTPNVLGDLYFNRSIIILTEVKEEEVVGFILNKCLDYSLSDLYKNVKNNKIKVHSGGPVNQDNFYRQIQMHNDNQLEKQPIWSQEFISTTENEQPLCFHHFSA